MASINCTTNTVTLSPGSTFILPPGATVIASSNVDGLSSTCADLSKLETPECFVALIAGGGTSGEGQSQYYEGTQSQIRGILIDGKQKDFSSVFRANFTGTFPEIGTVISEIVSASNGIISNTGTGISCGSGIRGCLTYILVKTIPSIGNTMKLILGSDIPSGSGSSTIIVQSQFLPIQTLVTQGYVNIPTCP